MIDTVDILEDLQSGSTDKPNWCTGPEIVALPSKIIVQDVSEEHDTSDSSVKAHNFMDSIRCLFYNEQREPPEEPDKIETHRMLMESERTKDILSPRTIVTKRYCVVERKGRKSMLEFVNQTLDENEIIRRYLSPGTQTNESAILFLASTIFSSNKYIFQLLNDSGFFAPASQNLVNALASDFINQSERLGNLILKAEQSSGKVVKRALFSCVNEFVSTSNKLSSVIQQDYDAKVASIGSTKEALLKNVIAKRNQISDSLYSFFQRTVELEKSIMSASTKSVTYVSKEVENTLHVLADAERFTKFLYAGLYVDRNTNTISVASHQSCQQQITTEPSTDMSDAMSTASSFLNYLNMSSLSGILDEDEFSAEIGNMHDTHLDAIFERMNLSLPNEKDTIRNESAEILIDLGKINSPDRRSRTSSDNPVKPPAKEKRRQTKFARTIARLGRKEKRYGQTKHRTKVKKQEPSKKE